MVIIILSVLLALAATYIFWLIRRMTYITQEVYNLVELTAEYEGHLTRVYDLPLFYEDATLKELLKHTRYHAQSCREFSDVFAVAPLEEIDDEELEEEGDTEHE
jgi:hypothetical protein